MTSQEQSRHDTPCEICGQPPVRHVAVAYGDHIYAQKTGDPGTPLPAPVRESLAAQMAATKLALTAAKEDPTKETP